MRTRRRTIERRRRAALRKGGVYLVVLFATMFVTVIGLGSLLVGRVHGNTREQIDAALQADRLALSAIEHAILRLNEDSEWRTNLESGVEKVSRTLGPGEFGWTLVDTDGSLSDDLLDPVYIYGEGRLGTTKRRYRVVASAVRDSPALNSLATALHCADTLTLKSTRLFTATGAPASTNKEFVNEGQLTGDVDAASMSGSGTVSGTVDVPAAEKVMPSPSLVDDYVARSTPLLFTGPLDQVVLTPLVNEYSALFNTDGVYSIDTGGADLAIRGVRLHGTLVIDVGATGTVYIDGQNFFEPYRADHATLIIRGNAAIRITSRSDTPTESSLSEAHWGHNYNPIGAPYLGGTDIDQVDTYPSEIRGVVYVDGNTTIWGSGVIRGGFICSGSVSVEDSNIYGAEFIHEPALLTAPPIGFESAPTKTPAMILEPGTWERMVDP
ncbi:MAG: hypothetical protein ACF8PN_07665 [Phycisphaerales bacterium]